MWEIVSNFVAFLENLNFKIHELISHLIRGYLDPVPPYSINTLHKCFFLSRSLCRESGRPASGLKSLDKSPVFYAIFLDEETFLQSGG